MDRARGPPSPAFPKKSVLGELRESAPGWRVRGARHGAMPGNGRKRGKIPPVDDLSWRSQDAAKRYGPRSRVKVCFFPGRKKEEEEARHAQLAFSRHVGRMLEGALLTVPGGLGTSLGARSRPAWTTGCPQSLPLSVDRPCGLPSCPHLLGLGPTA